MNKTWKYDIGELVKINGSFTRIREYLIGIEGGYRVHPPVDHIQYWNEDEMEKVE